MSRSGYSDDLDNWTMIKWRGQVASAIRGKRGQKCLVDLLAALEALPNKRLIRNALEDKDGEVCALGALGKMKALNLDSIDPENSIQVAATFDIAAPLAQEIVFENDDSWNNETAEQRYERMVNWVKAQIRS